MKDTQLYSRLLGIEKPWQVTDVQVALADDEVAVSVSPGGGKLTVRHTLSWVRQTAERLAPSRHLSTPDLAGG